MKRKMKYCIMAALTVCFCGAVGTGIGLGFDSLSVKAENQYGLTQENFYVRGASVRLVEDNYGEGVKFHIVMDKTVYENLPAEATTGTVVLPENLLAEGNSLTLETSQAEHRETTGLWFENAEGQMESVVYVYDIPEAYYGADIAVVGYVTAGKYYGVFKLCLHFYGMGCAGGI